MFVIGWKRQCSWIQDGDQEINSVIVGHNVSEKIYKITAKMVAKNAKCDFSYPALALICCYSFQEGILSDDIVGFGLRANIFLVSWIVD